MNTRNATRITLTILALAAMAVPAHAGPDRAGTCIRATIDGAVVLPDGSTSQDGTIRLCFTQRFSPVTGRHVAYVDGRPIGSFLSRRGVSEAAATEGDALMVLHRLNDGTLRLHAYAVRAGDRMVTYRFAGSTSASTPTPSIGSDVSELIATRPAEFTFITALR
jgi:hypothetical protein